MNRGLVFAGGIGLGAAMMYLLDPNRGKRRRALVRDQFAHLAKRTPSIVDTTARDLKNRARGIVAEMRSRLCIDEEVFDDVLVDRVRSKMGRIVSHPGAIQVTAGGGRIALSGTILQNELQPLLSAVKKVKGVIDVKSELESLAEPEQALDLQGSRTRPGERFELAQANWSPAARFLVGAAGGALGVYGLARRDALGLGLGTVGLGLLARGIANVEIANLLPRSEASPEMGVPAS
jgi:hypothetical protein